MIASTRCFLTLNFAASASMLFASGSALCASNMARFTASDKCALRKYSGSAPRPVRSYMNRIPESAGRTGGGGGPCGFFCAASGGLSGDSASVDNHTRVKAGAPGTLKAQRAPWRSIWRGATSALRLACASSRRNAESFAVQLSSAQTLSVWPCVALEYRRRQCTCPLTSSQPTGPSAATALKPHAAHCAAKTHVRRARTHA